MWTLSRYDNPNRFSNGLNMVGYKLSHTCVLCVLSFGQNRSFITQVAPKHIILVHGQKDEMGRLKSALMSMYKQYPEVSCLAV
jgi:Zn-dependent metallo-hydrolase RNA specificity domain